MVQLRRMAWTSLRAVVALLAGCFVALDGAYAQKAPSYYPFGVDQDKLNGAPDFSFLNHPLTAADRIFVRNGHFYTVGADLQPNTADDQRVRFFGISFAFGANFPDPGNGDAARIAKRLRFNDARQLANYVLFDLQDSRSFRSLRTALGLPPQAPRGAQRVSLAATRKIDAGQQRLHREIHRRIELEFRACELDLLEGAFTERRRRCCGGDSVT